MAEPTRKKQKGSGSNVIAFPTEASAQLQFSTDNPKKSKTIDLTEFEVGTMDPRVFPKIRRRFSGRKKLIRELSPFIQLEFTQRTAGSVKNLKPTLRLFWCIFDKHEDKVSITCLEDIDDFVGYLQTIERVAPSQKAQFLRIVNLARRTAGLPSLYWASTERSNKPMTLPPEEHIKALYHQLTREMVGVKARWEEADILAKTGSDWTNSEVKRHSKIHGYWSDAETHATYRGCIVAAEHPCPSDEQMAAAIGVPNSTAIKNREIAIGGLYPHRIDAQNLFFLFILKTGWNATTAFDLDVDNCIFEHPTSKEHHVVRATKARGNTEQVAIGLNKQERSPAGILKLIISRTAPLRKQIRLDLAIAKEKLKAEGPSRALHDEIAKLTYFARTPWLFATIQMGYGAVHAENYLKISHDSQQGSGLQFLIDAANVGRPDNKKIDRSLSLTDFRDAYIGFAYKTSGYSWLVAMLAAGHKNIESLKAYLRKRQYKAQGERKVASFSNALWREIKIHKRVEPAVLFALVQRGEITEEQRQRLASKTYVGTGCENFRRPPKEIAPDHKEGDGCRVQRCSLCYQGIVFDDTYDLMARRFAELTYIRETIPLLSWMQSSFPLEYDATEDLLSQFDEQLVSTRFEFWRTEIREGRHRPLIQEGAY